MSASRQLVPVHEDEHQEHSSTPRKGAPVACAAFCVAMAFFLFTLVDELQGPLDSSKLEPTSSGRPPMLLSEAPPPPVPRRPTSPPPLPTTPLTEPPSRSPTPPFPSPAPAIPPLPRPPPRHLTITDRLNQRYAAGRIDANDMVDAGVVIRGIGFMGYGYPWDPRNAPRTVGHISATLTSRQVPYYFMRNQAGDRIPGFIIAPEVAAEALNCAYYTDVASVTSTCSTGSGEKGCLSGCNGATRQALGRSTWCDTNSPTSVYSVQPWQEPACPWPPNKLSDMLREQVQRAAAAPHCACCSWPECPLYNELVLDSDVWTRSLPRTIEAFFFPEGESNAEEVARQSRDVFNWVYRLDDDPEAGPPLIRLGDLSSDTPFTYVPA